MGADWWHPIPALTERSIITPAARQPDTVGDRVMSYRMGGPTRNSAPDIAYLAVQPADSSLLGLILGAARIGR